MASIHSWGRFIASILPAIFYLCFIIPTVLTAPHVHNYPGRHQHPNRAAVAWLEEEQAKIEKVQRDNLCPNLHAPAEWFDYSVKVRGEEKKNDASCANPSSPGSLMKRDEYSCDENNPCGNGESAHTDKRLRAFSP